MMARRVAQLINKIHGAAVALLAKLRPRRQYPPPALALTVSKLAAKSYTSRSPLELPPVIYLPSPPPRALSRWEKQRHGANRPTKEIARFKADVLEKLDDYLFYIKRLKRWDAKSYAFYRRLGAFIAHPDLLIDQRELEPVLVQNLPAFGAVAIGGTPHTQDDGETFVPIRFAYFTKLESPGSDIERVNTGSVYRCHLYWDEDSISWLNEQGYGTGKDIVVVVLPDGSVRPLRILKFQGQKIHHKRGRGDYGHYSIVHHQRWGLPDIADPYRKNDDRLPQKIVRLFTVIANFWTMSAHHSMIRVTATKEHTVMPFVVDATDCPAFFKDREPVVSPDGVTRRMFHVVRAHPRKGTRGVRLHFAGLREFAWNGYQVRITVPGKDHIDLADASFGAIEIDEDMPAPPHTMDMSEMGDMIADDIGAPGKIIDSMKAPAHG